MTENNSINLLNKTFDVIELLSGSGREMGVSEISRRLNMVKSGTFRILNTLKERDLVYQNPSNKCYGLGLKFYFIGSAAQAGLPLCTVAKKHLDALSITYEESIELSIPYTQYSGSQLPCGFLRNQPYIFSTLAISFKTIACNFIRKMSFSIFFRIRGQIVQGLRIKAIYVKNRHVMVRA